MAEIFFTGPEYIKTRVPFLVNKNMELILPANNWLRYIALQRGRTQSPMTWSSYGYHAFYYFDWLETNNLDWNSVIEKDLGQYRTYLEKNNSSKGIALDRNSIHDYVSTVVRFYKWAYREGIISYLPFKLEDSRFMQTGDPGFFAKARKTRSIMEVADIVPRKIHRETSYISKIQQKILINDVLESEEDRLLYALLISTGIRLKETVQVKLDDIPEEDIFGRTKAYPLIIMGKGNKQRTVYIGHPLLTALLNWRDHLRSQKIKKRGARNRKAVNTFWLNSRGASLTRKSLWYRIRNWGRKAGFRLTPHMFRHTFGFMYYGKTKDIYALKRLLGHARVSSTEIYTHLDPEAILETVAQLDDEIMSMFKKK